MKSRKLSHAQRIAWYTASAVFGIFLIVFGYFEDIFSDQQTRWVAIFIFTLCWIIVVFLLRVFFRGIQDPADLSSYFNSARKRE